MILSLEICRISVLGEGLGAKDHNVTIFSPFLEDDPPKGVKNIFIENQSPVYAQYSVETMKRDSRSCVLLEFVRMALLSRQMCFSKY